MNIFIFILNTPLYSQVQTDSLLWKVEKNGCYSVKSAYRVCVEDVVNNAHLRKPGYWSGIWRLKVPPRVKKLVWRVCRECFPTRVRLISRGVNCPSACVKCEDPHEDCYHIFFHCRTAIDVWNTANVWHLIAPSLSQFDNAPDIIFNLLQKLSASQMESIVTIMWSIWKSRNLKLWQQVSESSVTILERAKHLLEGWRKANHKQGLLGQVHSPTNSRPQTHDSQNTDNRYGNIRWRKPKSGRLKCNVDASFSTSSNKVGIGMCIRDSEGNHVRSKTMWFSPLCPVNIGEALGLYHATRWINELQLTNVDFEVDSKTIADYFNKARGDNTEFGSIMENTIQFCNIFLTNSHVEFTRRQANEVAHELAKAATLGPSFHIFDESPTCISDLIFNEMI
uniref:Polynucleotidyl transferase, Ribonuclease H fold n=1 Tax=Medicago truncatula TaxID=3880 RepID=Q2HUC4_MEDTR|nr:Polynucleotidyl transferase, Ribonuclease H fold [Medicago truncatula]